MSRWRSRSRSLLLASRVEWDALGVGGRVALLGLVASLVVAAVLGIGVPAAVEDDLISSHLESLSSEVEYLVERGIVSADGEVADEAAFAGFWEGKTIGGAVVGFNVWDSDGTIVFSSAPGSEPYGSISGDRLAHAFDGMAGGGHAEGGSENPMHLWDFSIPVTSESGRVVSVIQLFEETPTLHDGLASIRRWLWLGLALGLGALFLFDLVVVGANTRELIRRRDGAETLLAQLTSAQETERARIVGALHDDIGQPLYGVLYGIEGVKARLGDQHPLSEELGSIGEMLRSVDTTLRSELRMLHQGQPDLLDLESLLQRLAADIRSHADLEVTLRVGAHGVLADGPRTALFRAAREAIANVRRHSNATSVDITIGGGRRMVAMQVDDDGTGFADTPGLGLTAVRTGLEVVGGGLRIMRRAEGGTTFRAWAPASRGVE